MHPGAPRMAETNGNSSPDCRLASTRPSCSGNPPSSRRPARTEGSRSTAPRRGREQPRRGPEVHRADHVSLNDPYHAGGRRSSRTAPARTPRRPRPAVVRVQQRDEPAGLGDGVVVDEREQLALRRGDAGVPRARDPGLGLLDTSEPGSPWPSARCAPRWRRWNRCRRRGSRSRRGRRSGARARRGRRRAGRLGSGWGR